MNPLIIKQDTPEWLELRKTKIGASDVPIIMGQSPFMTAYKLWLIKTGKIEQPEPTPAMKKGKELEPKVRALLEEKYEESLTAKVFVEPTYVMASIDAINFDNTLAFEIKCPNKVGFDKFVSSGIPYHYQLQMQYQMFAVGLRSMTFVGYYEGEFYEQTLESDSSLINGILDVCNDFHSCMQNDIPPETTEEQHIFVNDEEFMIACEEYKEACNTEALAAGLVKQAREKMLDMTDGGNVENSVIKITNFYRKGNVDYKKLCEELDVSNEKLDIYRKGSTKQTKITFKNNNNSDCDTS
jgi:putative phage-type endonuclease